MHCRLMIIGEKFNGLSIATIATLRDWLDKVVVVIVAAMNGV